ncbi:retrovirus-related Pol polyprotein from type-1 retrotransposable element R2 [Trichonephila clavipes]|nr:retrovirus-related Pol polyprotein from type-1 retrotransposable element R2 [Trichonephila clavipes]
MGFLCLHLNPAKCAPLYIKGGGPIHAALTEFSLYDTELNALSNGEYYSYLGKPVGFFIQKTFGNANEALQLLRKISKSNLSQWQKIDALKTYFFPSLYFVMRTDQLDKTSWTKVNVAAREELKNLLSLPPNASNHYLYRDEINITDSGSGLVGSPLSKTKDHNTLIMTFSSDPGAWPPMPSDCNGCFMVKERPLKPLTDDSVVSRRREGGYTRYRPLLNMQASKKEQRGVIRFLAAERVRGRKMHRLIKDMYSEYTLCRSSVVEWHKRFIEGLELLKDDA